MSRATPLFTVGHSNHPFEYFLALLRRHHVQAIADVRSRPYSRFVPHFSKERLARLLEKEGLGYLYVGLELGGRPPSGHSPSSVTYRRRVEQPGFRQGIDRLLEAARASRVALMCRERDPLDCHRFHLICRHLRANRLEIGHILANGEIEAQRETERRLLERSGRNELPLLRAAEEPAGEEPLLHAFDAWWARAR